MAPPDPPASTSSTSRVIVLVLNVAMFILLLISLIVLVTTTVTLESDANDIFLLTYHFDFVHAYRYMLASIVIGLTYSLLQIAFSVYHLLKKSPLITGVGGFAFDFFGDKVISYVLATGSAAGFGATNDLKRVADQLLRVDYFDDYFDKVFASASLLLVAFLCAAALSVISSYALLKMGYYRQQGQSETSSVPQSAQHMIPITTPSVVLEGSQVVLEQQQEHQNGQYPSIEVQQVRTSQITHNEPTNDLHNDSSA